MLSIKTHFRREKITHVEIRTVIVLIWKCDGDRCCGRYACPLHNIYPHEACRKDKMFGPKHSVLALLEIVPLGLWITRKVKCLWEPRENLAMLCPGPPQSRGQETFPRDFYWGIVPHSELGFQIHSSKHPSPVPALLCYKK
jgi:hypothetical protein